MKDLGPFTKELGRCPPHLNDEARAIWREKRPTVEKVGLATEADRPLFAHYCELTALYNKAMAQCQAGPVLRIQKKDGTDGYCLNPAIRAVTEYSRQLDSLRQQLGLSPLARHRFGIAVENDGEPDPFDAL
jgi:P27 family predicted phage terminase small subunit